MSLSKALAGFIKKTNYEDIPEDVIHFTKLCVLDWLASAIAGKEKPPIKMVEELVQEMGGTPHATLVTGGKSSMRGDPENGITTDELVAKFNQLAISLSEQDRSYYVAQILHLDQLNDLNEFFLNEKVVK